MKFALGLFEHPYSDPALLAKVGSEEHRAVAREAVSKSLVLLKNDGVFPIAKDEPTILVAGTANNIGFQSGGWTIEWQGLLGDNTPGTSLLDGIRNTVSADTNVINDPGARFAAVPEGENVALCIGVVGELPYAEGVGDNATLALSGKDIGVINRLSERCDKVAILLISGRPLIITDLVDKADAWVAAWLPGTEGQGVADVLFGDMPFTGKLPYTWPKSVDNLPLGNLKPEDVLFPYGFGLSD
jgi:beta-glucosidase